MSSNCKNIFLILAQSSHPPEYADRLKKVFENGVRRVQGHFDSIGDGRQRIKDEDLLGAKLEDFSKLLKNEPFGIVFYGHGELLNGFEPRLFLGKDDDFMANETWISSDYLSRAAQPDGKHNRPISIIYSSSCSHAALDVKGYYGLDLPNGSVAIGLSKGYQNDLVISNWVEALEERWPEEISAFSLLEAYLLNSWTKQSPKITIFNDTRAESYVLDDLFRPTLRTPEPVDAAVEEVGKRHSDDHSDSLKDTAEKIVKTAGKLKSLRKSSKESGSTADDGSASDDGPAADDGSDDESASDDGPAADGSDDESASVDGPFADDWSDDGSDNKSDGWSYDHTVFRIRGMRKGHRPTVKDVEVPAWDYGPALALALQCTMSTNSNLERVLRGSDSSGE